MAIITSLFPKYLADFSVIVRRYTELINEKKFEEALLYKEMLTPEFSADLSWGSNVLNTSIVAADVVSMDSPLPLKKRSSITRATGSIPKIGMKMRKGEKDISDIQVMESRGALSAEVARKLVDDVNKCLKGVLVRNEILFQQALSTGLCVVDSDTNTGVGIRVDFNYLDSNKLNATIGWKYANATPISDLRKVFDAANEAGRSFGVVMMSKKYFDYLKNSAEGKELNASHNKILVAAVASLPTPSQSGMLEALRDEFDCEFRIVNSTFRVEINGTQTSVRPWKESNIAFLPSTKIGRLVYGMLAEESNPVAGVAYEKSADGILVAKFAHNEPLEEMTTAQALSLPVIDGVEDIYLLQAGGILANPADLEFTSAADTTGKTVAIATDADEISSVSVPTSGSWATVTFSGKNVLVKVSANTASGATKRETTVTVTDSYGNVCQIPVTQNA